MRAHRTISALSRTAWGRLCGVVAIVLLVIASLIGVLAQPRTSLGWQSEHFLAYFTATLVICAGWPRPRAVTGVLVMLAALLEALQYFTPDRHPNLIAFLWGAAGVVVAAFLVEIFMRARRALEIRRLR